MAAVDRKCNAILQATFRLQPRNVVGMNDLIGRTGPDFLDSTLLCTISSSGSLLVVFTLTLLTFYGNQPCYLTFLSSSNITVMVAESWISAQAFLVFETLVNDGVSSGELAL